MHVSLSDLNPQIDEIRDEVKIAIDEVVESAQYINGPKVSNFERNISDYCDIDNAIGVSSGTDALLVSLMALDVGPGDIVLTTDYAFFSTTEVISRLNAQPVFLDIDPDTYNLDPKKLNQWLENNQDKTERVKAIIPAHLFGQCADMKPIIRTARKYNIPVIEDATQAFGAKYPNKSDSYRAGTMGKTGCFSFFPSNSLGGMGDGGMVVTRDDEIAAKIRKLRNHGAAPKYHHSMIGGNFRLNAIQAAVLSVKLQYLDKWNKMRQENAEKYNRELTDQIQTPEVAYKPEYHIYNQYVISVPGDRKELETYLRKKQIGYSIYYPVPFHQQECYQHLDYEEGDFPNSEYASQHSLAIPVYPQLSEDKQEYVIESLNNFFRN